MKMKNEHTLEKAQEIECKNHEGMAAGDTRKEA